MNPNKLPPAVMRTADAAAYVGLPLNTLEKARVTGNPSMPPFVRLGSRAVGYLVKDLDDWLASRRVQSTSETLTP
jgi:predicted DNA-binding transcriptional regulator AlpA